MTDWYKTLKFHPQVYSGMRMDQAERETSLGELELPSIFEHFEAASQDHFTDDSRFGRRLESVLEHLPAGAREVLYNSGTTHFLASGESETIVDQKDNILDDLGRYFDSCKCAVTEISGRGLEDTIRHEAGHALSYALGNVEEVLSPLQQALLSDLEKLTEEDWRVLEESGIEIFEKIALNIEGYGRFGLDAMSKDYVSSWEDGVRGPFNLRITRDVVEALEGHTSEDIASLFNNTYEAMDAQGYANGLPPLYETVSKHPAMIEAYQKDLQNLLDGNGPDGARLIEENGRAYIEYGEGRRYGVSHYVPEEYGGDGYVSLDRPEEPFAEIFADYADPIGPIGTHLAQFFPSMAQEVQGVLGALDRAYNERYDPSQKGPVPIAGPDAVLAEADKMPVPASKPQEVIPVPVPNPLGG